MKDLKWILKKLDIIMNNFFSRFPIFNKKKKKKKNLYNTLTQKDKCKLGIDIFFL